MASCCLISHSRPAVLYHWLSHQQTSWESSCASVLEEARREHLRRFSLYTLDTHTSASIANGYHISSSISPSLPLFPKYPSIFSRTNSPIHPANPSPKYRTAQTRWFGSKKFAIPSLTRYSCPQFPHTSIPSLTLVSNNSVCSSLIIFSSFSSSSFVGAVGGRVGKPSYIHRSVSLHSSRPGENSGAEEGDEGGRGRGGGNKLQKQ